MSHWVYLDHNATTPPAPQVVEAMRIALEQFWANPSSMHRLGQQVRQQVELARAQVARLVGCRDRELVFTSSGTEANNLALRGIFSAVRYRNPQARMVLVTSDIEHAAIRQPVEALKTEGVEIAKIPVDSSGRFCPEKIVAILERVVFSSQTSSPDNPNLSLSDSASLSPAVVLVTLQWANNETGVIQPAEEIGRALAAWKQQSLARHPSLRLLFHLDATQAVGKIPVSVSQVGADLLTFSAHKFHGPKGVGALYIKTGIRVEPQIRGGPQERDRRSGTENTCGIIGMGVAADLALQFLNDQTRINQLTQLRDRLEQGILDRIPAAVIHARQVPRLWNTTNIGFPQLEAEAILLGLSERGICVSAGAACSSGSLEPSPVLLAMGIPPAIAHGSVRFSLSRITTEAEITRAQEIVPAVIDRLRQTLPMG